jgi:hypothetical protein
LSARGVVEKEDAFYMVGREFHGKALDALEERSIEFIGDLYKLRGLREKINSLANSLNQLEEKYSQH